MNEKKDKILTRVAQRELMELMDKSYFCTNELIPKELFCQNLACLNKLDKEQMSGLKKKKNTAYNRYTVSEGHILKKKERNPAKT